MASRDTAKVVLLALIVSVASAVAMFWAAATTGASTLVALGLLFLAATGSQGLMLVGMSRRNNAAAHFAKRRTADLYVWSYVAALILFSLSAGVAIDEGIGKLMSRPRILLSPHAGYAAIALALILTAATLARIALRPAQKAEHRAEDTVFSIKHPALHATAIETVAALAGLIVAILGFALSHARDSALIDGIAATLIGLLIGTVAAVMGVEIRRILIGENGASALSTGPKPDRTTKSMLVVDTVPVSTEKTDAATVQTGKGEPRVSRGAQKRREQQQRRQPR